MQAYMYSDDSLIRAPIVRKPLVRTKLKVLEPISIFGLMGDSVTSVPENFSYQWSIKQQDFGCSLHIHNETIFQKLAVVM